jgi:hypothetical protein
MKTLEQSAECYELWATDVEGPSMKDQPEIPRDQNELLTIPKAGKDEDRPVNRLLKIYEAAQLELRGLEADFQVRLQESILQNEVKLKQQFADEHEQKIRQTEEDVRTATTQKLLARFEVDFQKFETAAGKWESERQQLHHEINKLQELEVKLSEVSQEKGLLQEEFKVAESHWNTERNNFESERQQLREELFSRFEIEMGQLKADLEDQRLKATADTEAAAEFRFAEKFAAARQDFERREEEIEATASQRFQKTTDEFDVERMEFRQQIAALEEELALCQKTAQQAIRTPLSRELEVKLEAVRSEKARLEEELREATARRNVEGQGLETTEAARDEMRNVSDVVKAEIARIESSGQAITQKIEDPSMDLATQIRLDRQRRELEAYLKGLRYSIDKIEFDNSSA